MVALFLFLKGMTGALAPFSYLVFNRSHIKSAQKTKPKLPKQSLK